MKWTKLLVLVLLVGAVGCGHLKTALKVVAISKQVKEVEEGIEKLQKLEDLLNAD